MKHFAIALLLFGAAVVAIKVAFLFLILAGLIFRTRETVGVLIVLAAIGLFTTYPIPSLIVALLFAVWLFFRVTGGRPGRSTKPIVWKLTDDTDP